MKQTVAEIYDDAGSGVAGVEAGDRDTGNGDIRVVVWRHGDTPFRSIRHEESPRYVKEIQQKANDQVFLHVLHEILEDESYAPRRVLVHASHQPLLILSFSQLPWGLPCLVHPLRGCLWVCPWFVLLSS